MADKKLPDPEHERNPDVYRAPEPEDEEEEEKKPEDTDGDQ